MMVFLKFKKRGAADKVRIRATAVESIERLYADKEGEPGSIITLTSGKQVQVDEDPVDVQEALQSSHHPTR